MTSYVGYLKSIYGYENINFLSRKLVETSIFAKIAKLDKERNTMLFITNFVFEYYSYFIKDGYNKLPNKTIELMDELYKSILSRNEYAIEMRLRKTMDDDLYLPLFIEDMIYYLCGDFLFRMCTLNDLCQLAKIGQKLVFFCYGYYEFEKENEPYYAVYFLYKQDKAMLILSITVRKIFTTFIEHMDKQFCYIGDIEYEEIEEFLETCVIIHKKIFDYEKDFVNRDDNKFKKIISKQFPNRTDVIVNKTPHSS